MQSKGQGLGEYVLTLTIVIAAFVSMQVYLQRGFQAKIRDGIIHQFKDIEKKSNRSGLAWQYEPTPLTDAESISTMTTQKKPGSYTEQGYGRKTSIDEEIKEWRSQTTVNQEFRAEPRQ